MYSKKNLCMQKIIKYFSDLFDKDPVWTMVLILGGIITIYLLGMIIKSLFEDRTYTKKNRKRLEETYLNPLIFEKIVKKEKFYRLKKIEDDKVQIDVYRGHPIGDSVYASFWFLKDSVPEEILKSKLDVLY